MCKAIEEPVAIPEQDSSSFLKNEEPARGNETKAILSLSKGTSWSKSLEPPKKDHSSNLERSVDFSIVVYLLKFRVLAV